MKQNLLQVYQEATDFTARDWYREAHGQIAQIARSHGLDLVTVAGIVAALSPRIQWAGNIAAAVKLINGQSCQGTYSNVAKAKAILGGGHPLEVMSDRAQKTRNFFLNLYNPDHPTAVTVDTWAARAYFLDAKYGKSVRDRTYQVIAQAYREASREVGLLPSEFQAIVWVAVRDGGVL